MDCCICSPMASVYRPPRNAVCSSCYEGAKAIIAFFNNDERADDDDHDLVKPRGSMKPNSSTKGMGDAWEQVKEMRGREEEAKRRAGFLALAWKEGIHHADIVVKAASGPPIPAHKAILASRSEVLRHVLSDDDDDGCKAPTGDSISLPELDHDELSLFLAFLYGGTLNGACTEHQLHALLVAADKYDVPFLGRACEARLAACVEPGNVLRTLEVAELSSSVALKERAMDTVVEHAEKVVLSPEYHEFAVRNASLSVEITRALLLAKSTRRARAG